MRRRRAKFRPSSQIPVLSLCGKSLLTQVYMTELCTWVRHVDLYGETQAGAKEEGTWAAVYGRTLQRREQC